MGDVIVIDKSAYEGTDELEVEFYRCPCGFTHVPHAIARRGDPATMTARFCPGCARPIEWHMDAR
jgi:hypothetical protein